MYFSKAVEEDKTKDKGGLFKNYLLVVPQFYIFTKLFRLHLESVFDQGLGIAFLMFRVPPPLPYSSREERKKEFSAS